MKILLVEDDQQFAGLLKSVLVAQHYIVDIAPDGQTGWELVQSLDYNLIVLDIELPRLDGVSLCRRLREQGNQGLVMLLTAKGSSDDKILGLDAGADDYVVKPIVLAELAARIRALLRRKSTSGLPVLEWGTLRLNANTGEVTYDGSLINLTAKEYALLELFLRNGQRIYSQSAILERLWSLEDQPPGEEVVRTHIKRLRQKLKTAGAADLIETVHGLGYRLNSAYRQMQRSPQSSIDLNTARSHAAPKPKETRSGERFEPTEWQENQMHLLERIVLLEQTIQLLQKGFSEEIRRRAQQDAHRLIGALGLLGVSAAAEIAAQIETLLQQPVELEQEFFLDHVRSLPAQVATLRHLVETTPSQPSAPAKGLSAHKQTVALDPGVGRRLLLVSCNEATANRLLVELSSGQFQIAVATNLQAAREAIQRIRPDLVWLNLSNSDTCQDELTFVKELSQRRSPVPVVVFEKTWQGLEQVTLLRGKEQRVLQQSISVLDAVTQALDPSDSIEAKIMIVDDDTLMLRILHHLLEPWGFQVTSFSHTQTIWQDLETVTPDLLILDVQIPDIDGIELCHRLRNHEDWDWLPILFLTGSRDSGTIQQIFAAGADDYISKPVVGPELVTRILNRLERTRLLRNQVNLRKP